MIDSDTSSLTPAEPRSGGRRYLKILRRFDDSRSLALRMMFLVARARSEIRELNFRKKQVPNKVVKDGIIIDIELKVEELLKLNRLRDRVQKHIVKVGEGYP